MGLLRDVNVRGGDIVFNGIILAFIIFVFNLIVFGITPDFGILSLLATSLGYNIYLVIQLSKLDKKITHDQPQ